MPICFGWEINYFTVYESPYPTLNRGRWGLLYCDLAVSRPLSQSRHPRVKGSLRVCAATQAPAEAPWVTHGLVLHVPVNFLTRVTPSLFLFFIHPQVWIPCLSHDLGFFLSLEWHDFLRAWSLGVSSGFIFGISFFVLPGECNQISYICLILPGCIHFPHDAT